MPARHLQTISADSQAVPETDSNILDQFKQIVDGQPLERKQMALDVLRTIFSYFEKNGA